MARENVIEVEGKVTDVLPRGDFKVELENKHTVIAQVSGKMRVNNIRISPGDTVTVAISLYDLTRGRITYRK
jgi:translation initiation factor IF-1